VAAQAHHCPFSTLHWAFGLEGIAYAHASSCHEYYICANYYPNVCEAWIAEIPVASRRLSAIRLEPADSPRAEFRRRAARLIHLTIKDEAEAVAGCIIVI
jgi:hypothetical protein